MKTETAIAADEFDRVLALMPVSQQQIMLDLVTHIRTKEFPQLGEKGAKEIILKVARKSVIGNGSDDYVTMKVTSDERDLILRRRRTGRVK